MPIELLTVPELAGETGISRQAMHEHLANGHIEPDFVANSRRLFSRDSVDRVRGQLVLNRLAKNRKP